MPTRRRAAGSKGQKSGSRQIKPVYYSEGENDEDKSDVSESEPIPLLVDYWFTSDNPNPNQYWVNTSAGGLLVH
jgi:hypothetical protein